MKAVVYPSNRAELKVGNVTYRSFYDNRLTKDDLELARLDLGETEEVKSASLHELKELLKEDKDFFYRFDDEYLLRYLRWRKFNVNKAYTAVRNFYTFRKEKPNIFEIPSNLDFLLSRDLVRFLPYKDKDGSPIYWMDSNKLKIDEMTVEEIYTLLTVYSDVVQMDPCNHINGLIGFWDFGNLTSAHIRRYATPSLIRILLKVLLSSYPWRIKQVVIFNCYPLMRGVAATVKLFLSKKLADRIILLGYDVKELHKYIDPCLLPKVYGGSIEPSECTVQQFIEDNLSYIRYERSFGSNIKE